MSAYVHFTELNSGIPGIVRLRSSITEKTLFVVTLSSCPSMKRKSAEILKLTRLVKDWRDKDW